MSAVEEYHTRTFQLPWELKKAADAALAEETARADRAEAENVRLRNLLALKGRQNALLVDRIAELEANLQNAAEANAANVELQRVWQARAERAEAENERLRRYLDAALGESMWHARYGDRERWLRASFEDWKRYINDEVTQSDPRLKEHNEGGHDE